MISLSEYSSLAIMKKSLIKLCGIVENFFKNFSRNSKSSRLKAKLSDPLYFYMLLKDNYCAF